MAPKEERAAVGSGQPFSFSSEPRPGAGGVVERVEQAVQRLELLRERPAMALGAVMAAIIVAGGGWWLGRPGSVAPVEAAIPLATTPDISVPAGVGDGQSSGADTGSALGPAREDGVVGDDGDATEEEAAELLVHVAGAVQRPGIVSLEPGSRIGDAVNAAGGPTEEADLHRLNLAAPVQDGLQIRVPVEGEIVSPVGVPAPVLEQPGSPADSTGGEAVVNVNAAAEAELETLPGIGPSLAAAIVEWRSARGPFTSAEDLLAVPGIGPAKLAALDGRIAL